jgi:uncharacterized DUF497 family protein
MIEFEWDAKKARANQKKHGLSFISAALGLLDLKRIELLDERKDYGEVRYQTIAQVNNRIIYIVYTKREGRYRIISARKANQDEREAYLQN